MCIRDSYHAADPAERAFGGRVEVELADGTVLTDEIAVADAHPLGARPFGRPDYVRKFRELAAGAISAADQDRFLDAAGRLPELTPAELSELALPGVATAGRAPATKGIF